MTTAIAAEITRRQRRRGPQRSLALDFADTLDAVASDAETGRVKWPSEIYRSDPVRFAHEILGFEPWARQIEIAETLASGKRRIAVSSGHKIGKSSAAAWIGLWFFCSFKDARVVFTSKTARQVDQILWREVTRMQGRSGSCLDCVREAAQAEPPRRAPRPCAHSSVIEGHPGKLARTGLKSDDFRELMGFTAREVEAVAGISGANVLYVVDEASGVDDLIFEAIKGNLAGGGYLLLLSNPTKTEGEFFDAFFDEKKRELYTTFRVSSEETPNVTSGEDVIPGLATRTYIEEMKLEYGEDSALYKIRVKGLHVLGEDGKIITASMIAAAQDRWEDTVGEGRLHIGLDPAESAQGDETAIAVRRGKKLLEVLTFRGIGVDEILVHVLDAIKVHRQQARELPALLKVDAEGNIGYKMYNRLTAHADEHPRDFEVFPVRASDRPRTKYARFDRLRDQLWASFADWIKDDGAIPEDLKLGKELHAPQLFEADNGRYKISPKSELKKVLGRSPDRADATVLATWEPASMMTDAGDGGDGGGGNGPGRSGGGRARPDEDEDLDPYAGKITPYGGGL